MSTTNDPDKLAVGQKVRSLHNSVALPGVYFAPLALPGGFGNANGVFCAL
jgi:hypothetical protein